jgi:hypothetical protein
MLEEYYPRKLLEVIDSLDWSINLPESMHDFFAISGDTPIVPEDCRTQQRLRARTRGVGYSEYSLPTITRSFKALPIYTKDFSRGGCGLIATEQFFPTERLRLLTPMYWIQIEVVRCRRLNAQCYEIGATLKAKHSPSMHAFLDLQTSTSICTSIAG